MTTKKKNKKQTVKKKTKAIICLDRSSSMYSCAGMAVEGYNEHVDEFQLMEENGEDIEVCLVTFNGKVYEHFWNVKPKELQKSSLESFNPKGGTACFDAIGYCVDKANEEDDGDTAHWLIVITDGDENSSRHYGSRQDPSLIAEVLTGCDNDGNWTISYLGASKEKIVEQNQGFGGSITTGNAAAWSNTAGGTKRMMDQQKAAVKSYFAGRSKGLNKVENLYSDSEAVADYTDAAVTSHKCDHISQPAIDMLGGNFQTNMPMVDAATAGMQIRGPLNYQANVGNADVFSTKSSNCVVDENYSRPGVK